jgi:Flp pilus assembly protein CpaB
VGKRRYRAQRVRGTHMKRLSRFLPLLVLLTASCANPCVQRETEMWPIWPKPRTTELTTTEKLQFATAIARATGELTAALRNLDEPERAYNNLHRAFNADGLTLRLLLEDPEDAKCARGLK